MTYGRRVRVVVPKLIGMEIIPAYKTALVAGVGIRGHDPGKPLPLRGVIITQEPGAGTSVWSGDLVTISLQPSTAERVGPSSAHAAVRHREHRARRRQGPVDDL